MATAKRGKASRGPWPFRIFVLLAVAGGALWFVYGQHVTRLSEAGTGFAAKTACSCRHIADRALANCDDDLGAGFAAIWLTEDAEAQSVTASVPGIASATATYSDGPGCVLQGWDG